LEKIVNSIKLNIKHYDEISNSLIVSFSSSEADGVVTQDLAYQPIAFNGVNNPEDVIKRIAFSGISLIERELAAKTFAQDTDTINAYKAYVGQTLEFNTTELAQQIISTETE
jgi:hypothetical protein